VRREGLLEGCAWQGVPESRVNLQAPGTELNAKKRGLRRREACVNNLYEGSGSTCVEVGQVPVEEGRSGMAGNPFEA
jgi:hypothetical protein